MKTFNLLQEHITLLRNSYTSWDDCEFGAAQIDPKRPYGNSDVYTDIHELLWPEKELDYDTDFDQDTIALMEQLHSETETALEIILHTGCFTPGKYEASDFGSDWKFVESIEDQL